MLIVYVTWIKKVWEEGGETRAGVYEHHATRVTATK